MSANKDQIQAAFNAMREVAETIREMKRVPSGILWAQLMGKMDFTAYEKMIGMLKRAELVRESGHVLEWIGPNISEEQKQNSLVA